MKILTNREVFTPPSPACYQYQILTFDNGTVEYDAYLTQTTAILTAELYNGKAAKNDAGEWVAAPGARIHDWGTSLLNFHVGLTMIGADSDGKHIYDYTVITPTGVAFHGDGKDNTLGIPSGWDTVRVAAEAIAWICIGPDDGVDAPTMDAAQTMWYYSVNRESASADIDEWIEKYDRGEHELTGDDPKPSQVWEQPTDKQLDTMAEDYVRNYIHGNQSGLITHLLSADDGYLSWDDVSNLYLDVENMSLEEIAALIDEHDGTTDAWRELVCEDGVHAAGDEITQDNLELLDLDSDDADILRDFVKDRLESREIYEWWMVDEWLADQLEAIGEPTLTDGMSHWWGRTCTGQRVTMDGTLQKIAARYLNFD